MAAFSKEEETVIVELFIELKSPIKVKRAFVKKYRKEKNPKKATRSYKSIITKVNQDSRVEKVDMVIFTRILNVKLKEDTN